MSDTQPKSRPYWVWGFNALLFGFIVWGFLHVPTYRIPTWPNDWAPTGEKWEAEWIAIPFDAQEGRVEIDRLLPATRSARLFLNGGPDGWQWARYDFTTQTITARTPSTTTPVSMGLAMGAVISTDLDGTELSLSVADVDPITYEARPWTGHLAYAPIDNATLAPLEDVTLLGFSFIPEGGASILMLTGDYLNDETFAWWIRFDAHGKEIARRELADNNFPAAWVPVPEGNPYLFIRQLSFAGYQGPAEGIDIRTGEVGREMYRPAQPGADDEPITYRIGVPATHRGYATDLYQGDQEAVNTDLLLVYSTPSVLCQIYPATLDKKERASQLLARARRAAWDQMYEPAELKKAAVDARRLDQIYLRVAGDDVAPWRPIGGDLSMGVRIAAAQRSATDPTELPEESEATPAELAAYAQVESFAGPEKSVVITQFLPVVPTSLDLPHGLFRLGLMDPDATEVTWLGWVPLTESVPTPGIKPTELHLARMGDSLLCWLQEGDFAFFGLPVWYTLIPCPKELLALPEGELR